jgi:serine/threonine protein kinase
MADDDKTHRSSRAASKRTPATTSSSPVTSSRRNSSKPSSSKTLPSPLASEIPLSDSSAGCLSEDQILAYLEGRTTTQQRDQVDRHLDTCQACWQVVDVLLGDVRVPSEELPAPFRITTFSVGSLIAERYRVERFIGKGGMGEVYRAHDMLMQKVVALKTPLCTSCDDPSALRKFFDEARNADVITHPNICRIHSLHEHRDAEGDRPSVPFFTMEYLEGETLAARLRRGPLPLLAVRNIARQLLLGLCAAHEKRVLHLDFKADNVMLRRSTSGLQAVIMDFGLSRQRDAVLRASQYQRGIGTVQYMAIEQLEGQKNLTPAVDVYAFGVVLFEMLTRRLPYLENSLGAMLIKHQRERPPLPSELRPGLTAPLDDFVMRCLNRTASRRFEDARAALAAFDALPAWTGRSRRAFKRQVELIAGGALALMLAASSASEAQRDVSSVSGTLQPSAAVSAGIGALDTSATTRAPVLHDGTASPAPMLPVPPPVQSAPSAQPPPDPSAVAALRDNAAPVGPSAPRVRATTSIPPQPKPDPERVVLEPEAAPRAETPSVPAPAAPPEGVAPPARRLRSVPKSPLPFKRRIDKAPGATTSMTPALEVTPVAQARDSGSQVERQAVEPGLSH